MGPDAVAARVIAIVSVPSGLTEIGGTAVPLMTAVVAIVEPAAIPVPVIASPGATWVFSGTVMNRFPRMVVVCDASGYAPDTNSVTPTLVNDLIPNVVTLAPIGTTLPFAVGGQLKAVFVPTTAARVDGQVYAVVPTLPTGR